VSNEEYYTARKSVIYSSHC